AGSAGAGAEDGAFGAVGRLLSQIRARKLTVKELGSTGNYACAMQACGRAGGLRWQIALDSLRSLASEEEKNIGRARRSQALTEDLELDMLGFVGEWSDSLGNDVRVVSSGRGIEVKLQKANGRGKEISLTIKKAGASFECGHYDLDDRGSHENKVVWRDRRRRDSSSV
ncbi:unnamed protein product, partial [Polarella glacialis]